MSEQFGVLELIALLSVYITYVGLVVIPQYYACSLGWLFSFIHYRVQQYSHIQYRTQITSFFLRCHIGNLWIPARQSAVIREASTDTS